METLTCLIVLACVFANCEARLDPGKGVNRKIQKRDAESIKIEGELRLYVRSESSDLSPNVITGESILEIVGSTHVSTLGNTVDLSSDGLTVISVSVSSGTLEVPEINERNLERAQNIEGTLNDVVATLSIRIGEQTPEDVQIQGIEGVIEMSKADLESVTGKAGEDREALISGEFSAASIGERAERYAR